jgi:DNA-directed RNA polymerase subunit E'
MYFEFEVKSAVRVEPKRLYTTDLKKAIMEQLVTDLEGEVVENIGRILKIIEVGVVGDGVIVPGDGAAFYATSFKVLAFRPEIHEIVEGEVKDIAKFGAFVDFGPFEGMVHVSQTMDDFVSLDEKNHTLAGKDSKHVLKVGDKIRARIIAISYKDPTDPKIGLTMRQPYMGKMEWIEEVRNKELGLDKKKKSTKAKAK